MNPSIDDLNRDDLNVRARVLLLGAGETIDNACLHIVQLARWGIEKAGIEADPAVAETVRAMASWRSVRLVNFFGMGRGGSFSIEGWEEAGGAVDLARLVLAEIDCKTFDHFPCYLSGD
jgi:hypothetical protein